jgi:hypothetical protein
MKDCIYSGRCKSEGVMCANCLHRPDVKEDHYIPDGLPPTILNQSTGALPPQIKYL